MEIMLYYASFETAEALWIRDNVMIIVTHVAPGGWFELTARYLTVTYGIKLPRSCPLFPGIIFYSGRQSVLSNCSTECSTA